jgi:2,3-dihydroxybenzoate decarboxylase
VSADTKPRIITIEEHYWDAELIKATGGHGGMRNAAMLERLHDLGALRIKEMDEAGIDFQVISHGAPATQRLPAESAVRLARETNDRLAAAIKPHRDRFAAFGVLPTPDPAGAADELDRVVSELGFKGGIVHGLTNGAFLDEKRFWPIFARAEKLDVPLYLHPATPHEAVVEAYYKDYVTTFPNVISSAWGFTVETATQAIRMVLSGVFETHPGLKIIIGHMGETLPFLMGRISESLSRPGNRPLDFRKTFCSHFHITTSGNFSTPALICTMLEMGADRVIFSVDWPFVANPPGVEWMKGVPLSAEDKAKILGGNAAKLLKL